MREKIDQSSKFYTTFIIGLLIVSLHCCGGKTTDREQEKTAGTGSRDSIAQKKIDALPSSENVYPDSQREKSTFPPSATVSPQKSTPIVGKTAFSQIQEGSSAIKTPEPAKKKVHPKIIRDASNPVKALYMTGWVAGTKRLRNDVIQIATSTEINAIVIDIKDYSGTVSYITGLPKVEKYKAEEKRIRDIDELLEKLHAQDLYVIGRITIFQDPKLTAARPDLALKTPEGKVWKDRKKLSWVDPACKEVWDYNLDIARDAIRRGFDEINFDYIRFPSDGIGLSTMIYPYWKRKGEMTTVLCNFFRYVRKSLPNTPISADIFGLTTVANDDLGIGQLIEDAYENFDNICPMVYPSHFAAGFKGYKNPADHPYEVVKFSMEKAIEKLVEHELKKEAKAAAIITAASIRSKVNSTAMKANGESIASSTDARAAGDIQSATKPKPKLSPEKKRKIIQKLRPWFQDFDMGAKYTIDMVQAQIKGASDAGLLDTWQIWNPRNKYRKAIFKSAKK